jgi:putative FmdB family regulatory protein
LPIYEYACRSCGHPFEFLSLPGSTAALACPVCHGEDLERLLSGFAVNSAELSQARVDVARKRMAGSRDTKDKQMAQAEYEKHHREEH